MTKQHRIQNIIEQLDELPKGPHHAGGSHGNYDAINITYMNSLITELNIFLRGFNEGTDKQKIYLYELDKINLQPQKHDGKEFIDSYCFDGAKILLRSLLEAVLADIIDGHEKDHIMNEISFVGSGDPPQDDVQSNKKRPNEQRSIVNYGTYVDGYSHNQSIVGNGNQQAGRDNYRNISVSEFIDLLEGEIESLEIPSDKKNQLLHSLRDIVHDPYFVSISSMTVFEIAKKAFGL
jgi:hypothetical protein